MRLNTKIGKEAAVTNVSQDMEVFGIFVVGTITLSLCLKMIVE
jgi:hypothetical protein